MGLLGHAAEIRNPNNYSTRRILDINLIFAEIERVRTAISMMRAKYHLLTGEPLPAMDAYALGMITKLVGTPEECGEAAEALAQKIAARPPIAILGTKTTLYALRRAHTCEVLERGALLRTSLSGHD